MKKTEMQKIRERTARRAFWKARKQDILELVGVLVFGGVAWYFLCLLCYVFPDYR